MVVDLTDFSPVAELPLPWLKRCLQMCPPEILPCISVSYLRSTYHPVHSADGTQTITLYNPNTYAKKRLRRIMTELSAISEYIFDTGPPARKC